MFEDDWERKLKIDPLLYEHLHYGLRANPKLARIAVLGQGSLASNVPKNVVPEHLIDHWKEWSLMYAHCADEHVLWALDEGEKCHLKLLRGSTRTPKPKDIILRAPDPDKASEALQQAIQRAKGLYTVTPHECRAQDACVRILQEASSLLL